MRPFPGWLVAVSLVAFTWGLWLHSATAQAEAWVRGWTREMTCPGIVLATGTVSSADHELEAGYFSIGQATVVLNPQGIPYQHLTRLRGHAQELVIRPTHCRELQHLEGR